MDTLDTFENPLGKPKKPGNQLDLMYLIIFLIGGFVLGQLANAAIMMSQGITLDQLSSGQYDLSTQSMRLIAFTGQLFTFLIPGIFISWIIYKREALTTLGILEFPPLSVFILSGLLIIASLPATQLLYLINLEIPMPDILKSMEDSTNDLIATLLRMETPLDILTSVIVIGLIPAIGEELIFRGLIINILKDKGLSTLAVLILSALIFSAFHMQFQGFIPRFFLGLLLGYLYIRSGSLWLSITTHFVFNSFQVVAASYLMGDQAISPDDTPSWDDLNIYGVLISIAILGFILYLLAKRKDLKPLF